MVLDLGLNELGDTGTSIIANMFSLTSLSLSDMAKREAESVSIFTLTVLDLSWNNIGVYRWERGERVYSVYKSYPYHLHTYTPTHLVNLHTYTTYTSTHLHTYTPTHLYHLLTSIQLRYPQTWATK